MFNDRDQLFLAINDTPTTNKIYLNVDRIESTELPSKMEPLITIEVETLEILNI